MERRTHSPDFTLLQHEFLDEYQPDAFIIFSGGISKRTRNNVTYYSTTSYQDFGLGGKARVHAAAHLALQRPDVPILTLSSVNPEAPAHADIMTAELIRKGIAPERILQAAESYNTFTEVLESYKQAKIHGWESVAVVSNDYHLNRIKYMFTHIDSLSEQYGFTPQAFELAVSLISAEDVLSHVSSHYQKVIDQWKKSPHYTTRVGKEKRGLEQLQNGTYHLSTRDEAIKRGNG